MKETELAARMVEFLSDYDLYFEIPMLNTDIVVKDGNILTGIETKTSLNFKVIEQAYFNKNYYHYSYIAVPWVKSRTFAHQICADYGIGIYEIHLAFNGLVHDIYQPIKPKFNRKAYTKAVQLNDSMKRSIPGASGSDGTTMTSFKITVENMEKYISKNQGCTFKDLFNNIPHHYSTFAAARNSTYQWINKGVIKNIHFDKGKLYYTEPT